MNSPPPTTDTSPEKLRAHMVDRIVTGRATSTRVEEALRTVPRHAFVPAAPITKAYANQAVITKRDRDGASLSCASVPTLVALMLDQLDVPPGARILEIGAGTGYNAALLAYLAGPCGHVSTVDIDSEVTAQARAALDSNGFNNVHVVTGDGALGDPDHAPFDRAIVTAGAWDIPAAWWDQLATGGRLVVPLRWRGQTRTIAFVREADRMRSESVELCGFVPMVGQDGERTDRIDSGGLVSLYWDADQPIAPGALHGVLDQPKATTWSGETVAANEPFDGLWLRLTGTEPGTCRIAADEAAVTSGLCTPAIPIRTPALVEDGSLAYFVTRRREDSEGEPRWDLGAIGHGPAGQRLADRLCEQIRAWSQDRTARLSVTAYPAGTPDDQLPEGLVIDKHQSRLVVS